MAPILPPTEAHKRWASCSRREYGEVGAVSHLIAPGALTTKCGATASHPDIWRADPRKPECPDCTKAIAGGVA